MKTREKEVVNYGFYSKLLKKPFDTVAELEAAEEEYRAAHALEIKAREERKAEADEIKAAIKARLEAELAAKQAKADAYKVYLEACDNADKTVKFARETENKLLTIFCEKHPEGFHDTIQIGDVTYKCNYSLNTTSYTDPFIRLLNWF